MKTFIPNSVKLSRRTLIASAAAFACAPGAAFALQAGSHAVLADNITSNHRSPGNRARDAFRKPFETIAFLGVEPHHKVVEILPGSGAYWLEFLAPYLRERGLYIAASRDASQTISVCWPNWLLIPPATTAFRLLNFSPTSSRSLPKARWILC